MNLFTNKIFACILITLLGMAPLYAAPPTDEGTSAYREGDYARAFQIWNEAAQRGDYRAQFLLSSLYSEGRGVPKDQEIALKWLNSAAAGGFDAAQFNLGNNYYNGIGVTEDQEKAVTWWTRSARQGFTQAQYNLGVAYLTGKGVERSDSEAVRWFGQAAIAGSQPAREVLEKMGIDIYGPRAGDASPSPGQSAETAAAPPQQEPPRSWLESQPAHHYTLQLFSTSDKAKASAFAEQLGTREATGIVPFKHQGTVWYRVVRGQYPNRSSATSAIASLPLKRWKIDGALPKSIGELREDMLTQ
jgi:TPR repeat protein